MAIIGVTEYENEYIIRISEDRSRLRKLDKLIPIHQWRVLSVLSLVSSAMHLFIFVGFELSFA